MAASLFDEITSVENLFESWREFRAGKRSKPDVQRFERHLERNLFTLRRELVSGVYRHGSYKDFVICDPKRRHIHKAAVRDRVVHHATYRVLYPLFDQSFIDDSYSCRVGKGTHAAVRQLEAYVLRVSQHVTRPCWALKCDVAKFFDSIDHSILLELLFRKLHDEQIQQLLRVIVDSYATREREPMLHAIERVSPSVI